MHGTIRKKTGSKNFGEFGKSIVIRQSLFSPKLIAHCSIFAIYCVESLMYFWKHFKRVLHRYRLFCVILLKGVCHTSVLIAFACH